MFLFGFIIVTVSSDDVFSDVLFEKFQLFRLKCCAQQPPTVFIKTNWANKTFLHRILSETFTDFVVIIPIPYFQHFLSGAAEMPRTILVRWPRCHLKLAGSKNSITDTPRRVKWEVGRPGGKWRQTWMRNGEDEPFPSSWQASRQQRGRREGEKWRRSNTEAYGAPRGPEGGRGAERRMSRHAGDTRLIF